MRLRACTIFCVFLAAGLSATLVGCTIMDELDNANKTMKVGEPSPGQKPPDAAADPGKPVAAKPKKPEPGILDRLFAWTKKTTEPGPKPHDPKDPIVKCQVHGSVSFVYKFDCQQSGGVVMGDHKA